MSWLLVLIGGFVVVDVLVHLVYGRLVLRVFETKPPFSVPAFPPDATADLVSFKTNDGITLRGSIQCHTELMPKGLILFCPELEGNHWSAGSYARGLLEAGYVVFSFDFRNQGESDSQQGYSPLHWPTTREAEDVQAALRYIQSQADLRVLPLGVMGVSRGSMMALIAAAEADQVKAVCCEGAYSTSTLMLHYVRRWCDLYVPKSLVRLVPVWHLRITSVLARWMSRILSGRRYVLLERWLPRLKDKPVLLIAGACDNYVDSNVGRELMKRVESESAEFWLVPRARHNRARHVGPVEYDRRLRDFFDNAFGHETTATVPMHEESSHSEPAQLQQIA